jgi:pyruvate,water dikinase
MHSYIRAFSEITVQDVPLVGGKGANLGEMTRAGLPVPPGFCLTADAYREFTAPAQAAIATILNSTRLNDPEELERASTQLHDLLLAQSTPEELTQQIGEGYVRLAQALGKSEGTLAVAVRSSATAEDLPDASFAGQQDTYLNVRGEPALLEHIKRCWASLWTARALSYRHKQGYDHEKVALAVVVQAMIESEVAGILFTANPVSQRLDEMVLNASWGLGEAVVSGLVTPDTWIIRRGGEIVEREIAAKEIAVEYAPNGGTHEVAVPPERQTEPALDDVQVQALAALGDKVAQHYQRPMDIEWGSALGHLYLLQARPITTLGSGGNDPGSRINDPVASSQPGAPADPGSVARAAFADAGEYNRTMFVEIFPDPLSPAFLSVIAPLFHSMLAFTFETLGLTPPRDIPAVGVFYNQPYFHTEYIEAALAPFSPALRNALVAQFVNPFSKHTRKLPTEASPAFLSMVTRLLRFMTAFPRQLPGLLAQYRTEIRKLETLPLQTLSDTQILSQIRELLYEHASKLLNYDFLMIALIGITYQMLGSVLERYYGEQTEQVRAKLISGVTGNVTMETNKRIWNLAQEAKGSPVVQAVLRAGQNAQVRQRLGETGDGRIFLAELDAFLEQYGHREIRMDILYPTWGEDPAPVLQFLRGYLDVGDEASPQRGQERLVREREQLAQGVAAHLQRNPVGRFAVTPLFQWVLKNTQVHTRERDTMHFELTRLFPPLRRALLELAARWQAHSVFDTLDDIFFLTLPELEALASSPRRVQNLVNARRSEFLANAQISPPPILREGVAVESSPAQSMPSSENTDQLRGIAGSPGIVTGVVRIIRGPHDFDKLQRGEILVAPLTNPVWTPLFAIAGGVITQVGGILSHGAIVAREYGIPAVMAVQNALHLLRDGQRVTVDGNKGVVYVQAQEAPRGQEE